MPPLTRRGGIGGVLRATGTGLPSATAFWLQIVGPDHPGIYYMATIVSLPYEKSGAQFGRWYTDIQWDYRIYPPLLRPEGLTSVLTKVQAKRWSHSVSGRIVRELRGALRVDERGLIVTTAEFTPQAFREASAEGKAKIGLLGGDALVRLCAERGVGVDRRQVTLLELTPGELVVE